MDPAGIIDCQKYTNVPWKNVGFVCRATTLVYLANENNVIETNDQLNTSILHIKIQTLR